MRYDVLRKYEEEITMNFFKWNDFLNETLTYLQSHMEKSIMKNSSKKKTQNFLLKTISTFFFHKHILRIY